MSDQQKKKIKEISIKDFELKEDTQSLYKAVKDNPKDKIELEIGDSKDSSKMYPQAKVMRWGNEVNLSVRYQSKEKSEKVVSSKDDKIVWSTAKEEVHIYEKPDIGEDGGLEIEVVLAEKPISNVIEFTIETKGLDFFYQPELTAKEIKDGATRPENVVGSYAVYHSTKRDNFHDKEYKTGKAFHIYRPKVIDSNGSEIWGELNVDVSKKLLTITIDEKWLEKAVYPVLVDPTFGYTSVGGSNSTVAPCEGTLFTSPPDITQIDSISVYASMGSGPSSDTLKMAVYKQSDMTLVSNSLTSTITINSPSAGSWRTHSYPTKPTISSSTNYLLSFQCLTWSHIDFYYDSGDTNQLYEGVYGSFTIGDSPWSSDNYTRRNYKFSIYATYTASGGTEADSERGLYITGYSTSNSTRGLYIQGSLTSNSTRGLYMTGYSTSTSERGLYLQGYLTGNSTRGLYIEGFVDTLYSRESSASLKTDDSNLSIIFSEQDYTDVATDDNIFVDLEGTSQYFQLLFKEPNGNGNNTDDFKITWKGKSSLAPSSSAVYLQIYNRTTESWTTLVSNSSANADTEFTLEDTVNTDLSDYYDENYIISVRVYQDGVV